MWHCLENNFIARKMDFDEFARRSVNYATDFHFITTLSTGRGAELLPYAFRGSFISCLFCLQSFKLALEIFHNAVLEQEIRTPTEGVK
jgi:hypothetical protein